jgi:hypothetical protein
LPAIDSKASKTGYPSSNDRTMSKKDTQVKSMAESTKSMRRNINMQDMSEMDTSRN